MPTGESLLQVEAGHDFSAALKTDGTVEAWGSNNVHFGVFESLTEVTSISLGKHFWFAVHVDGSITASCINDWLDSETGQYNDYLWDLSFIESGNKKVSSLLSPWGYFASLRSDSTIRVNHVELNEYFDKSDYIDIVSGAVHVVALRSNGSLEVGALHANEWSQVGMAEGEREALLSPPDISLSLIHI